MKILYTNFHGTDGGGHTTYVLALARMLRQRHGIHVAAPAGSRLYREAQCLDGVQTVAQPFPNGLRRIRQWRMARRQLRDYLRRHAFDVVHVNGSADHRLVMQAARALPRRPAIVFTKHNSKPLSSLGQRWRARFGTDAVIAVCDYTRRQLAHSPYRRCYLATVYNGVDVEHFSPWAADAARRERRRWCADDDVLLGSNAGTARYKGWMDLVEALALLPPAWRARVHVLLAGRPASAEARQRIAELGLERQVHFAGLLQDVRPVLAAMDAGFVLSYGVETISFACREMMAMGRPVLVSDYAGLAENIDAGVDGWVVRAHDRQAIADAIAALWAQRHALPAMGEAARHHAAAAFGLAPFADGTEAVYRHLMAP